jgi:hypothetical protein
MSIHQVRHRICSVKSKRRFKGDNQVENALRDQTLVDVIRMLTSQGESGRLQITSGMTDGAVFVDGGQLIDARFGKLTGFQAINALASVQDVNFSFDPSIEPPTQSSITPSERVLLRDFFGIGEVVPVERTSGPDISAQREELSASDHAVAAETSALPISHEDPHDLPFEHEDAPVQVVPLSEVDQRENLETHQPFVPEASSRPLSAFTESSTTTPAASDYYDDEAIVSKDDEVTVIRSRKTLPAENRPPITYGPGSRSRFRPGLFVTILTILMAVAAFAVAYRFRQRSSATPTTVQTSPDAADQQVSNSSTTPAEVQTSTPASDPHVANSTQTTSVVPDLTGNWNVTNTVEQTAYQPYKNMQVGFELAINQTGNEFTGKGQKVSENGQSLPGTSRTPIVVQGSIEGDKVEATFSESGATRKTSGRFVWRIDRAKGGLTGTFASTAARSRGRSAATKRF